MTGHEMREFRKKIGYSQEQFGAHLGIGAPQIAISQFESGERVITKRLQKAIEAWQYSIKIEKKLEKALSKDGNGLGG